MRLEQLNMKHIASFGLFENLKNIRSTAAEKSLQDVWLDFESCNIWCQYRLQLSKSYLRDRYKYAQGQVSQWLLDGAHCFKEFLGLAGKGLCLKEAQPCSSLCCCCWG